MSSKCPVCKSDLNSEPEPLYPADKSEFNCPRCGKFVLTGTLIATLGSTFPKDDKQSRIKISHSLRKMQLNDSIPELNTYETEEIIHQELPKLREQADLLIRWLGKVIQSPGETVSVSPENNGTIIGATSAVGFEFVLSYLFDSQLVSGHKSKAMGSVGQANITLTFSGWDYYEQLNTGAISYGKAFMAMKFGDNDLNQILQNIFKPAVAKAGFDLYKLDEIPVAGLIDDRLRVEIQSSVFVVADLTHDNNGAYWEAGYAEGLGKPVIYTCERQKFEEHKTHFDTNHHLTIVWDKDNPEPAGEQLKATIRATLPTIAILRDT